MMAESCVSPALAEPTSGHSRGCPTELALAAVAVVRSPAEAGPMTEANNGGGVACVGGVEGDTGDGMCPTERPAVPCAVGATSITRHIVYALDGKFAVTCFSDKRFETIDEALSAARDSGFEVSTPPGFPTSPFHHSSGGAGGRAAGPLFF